jgi:hypothetical protein
MPFAAPVPRFMIERKPRHGSPCNGCGACCYSSLCDLAKTIHGDQPGPCPELVMTDEGSRCGVVECSEGVMRDAALLLINAGNGCDMKLTAEQRNLDYSHRMDTRDRKNRDRLTAARKLWRME